MTHVWGREYLDLFFNVCIPNQLAPGNVPALPHGSRYRILTRSIHVDELDAHPSVRALRQVIPVDIVVVDAIDRQTDAGSMEHLMDTAQWYEPMVACHQRAVADILDADAAIIMLSADFVLSANALAAVVRLHHQGYRAVLNTGLRVTKEPFLVSLGSAGARLDALSSRELVQLALPHLHQEMRSQFADARPFSDFPSSVYWRVGSEGLVARCFHLHPLMVDPVRPVPLVGTNDDHYVAEACPDFSQVHVVTDSDELQMFELTTVGRTFGTIRPSASPAWQAALIAAECDALQLRHWQECPISIHAADVGEAWSPAAAASAEFVRQVMDRRPYTPLGRPWGRIGFMRDRVLRYAKTLGGR